MPLGPLDYDTGERQTLDEIRDWHGGMVDALIDQRSHILRAIRVGSTVAPRFVTMTESDFEVYYDIQRRELDRLTILNFVASAEASVKDDFFHRIKRKLKDPLAVAYKKWHKQLPFKKRVRPDFDEGGILDVLKEAKVMDNHLVGQYRACLRPRHWVGHGRNWDKPIEVDQLDPEDVYQRCRALLEAIPT